MKLAISAFAILVAATALAAPVVAHGGKAHVKCKKGYVLTNDHRCLKP
ncbi:MAG: hypothetical protein ABL894_02305 [Hyphomicrobium sp.]